MKDYSSADNCRASQASKQPRRVILLALDWSRDKDPRTPLGHLSILSSLKAAQIDVVSIVEPVATCNLDDLCARICSQGHEDRGVDLAIGVYCWNDRLVQRLLPAVRLRGFSGRIILGGPQISFMDVGFKSVYPDADVFICGEGEEALERVTRCQGIIQFPGVHYGIIQGTVGQARCDLKSLPSPWLQHDWQKEPLAHVRWETMRGCPFSCNFCQHRRKQPGINHFGLPRLFQEIDLFCRQKVASISVLDPVFNVGADWATTILRAFVERKYKGRISLQCRAELVTDEFLDVARQLDVKLEFGLQTIHASEAVAINRTNNIPKVEEALFKIRCMKIQHEVSIIFGLPNQTLQSFLQTVEWCLNRDVPVLKAFPLMLLKGTELAHSAGKWNMKESDAAIPWVKSSDTFTEYDWTIMNAVSSYLQETEGFHPKTLRGRFEGHDGNVNFERWSPHALNTPNALIPLAQRSTTILQRG